MKKALPIIIVILVLVSLGWYFTSGPGGKTSQTNSPTNNAQTLSSSSSSSSSSGTEISNSNGANSTDSISSVISTPEDSEGLDDEIKPATDVYKNADEALQAIKNAAKNYDDVVLEQFSELGPNCTWCDNFYHSVKNMMLTGEASADEKSYFAEVLAISGRVENIQSLVEAIKSSIKPEDADVYSEALELAAGKDDVTTYLGTQLAGANDSLRESLIAAITNQSSRLAAETLYKHITERGDADGYYSQGIGLGEFIPNEEAMPFLQELVLKRDQYSHLAVKSLLNSGADGLRMVMDSIENSKDADFDRKMLKDAVDHVNFDDDVEELLKKRKDNTTQPVLREFIEQALESFSAEAVSESEEESSENVSDEEAP